MRLPGFHRLSLEKRLELVSEIAKLSENERRQLRSSEPLSVDTAETMIENAIGVFGLPFGLAANFLIDGKDYIVPMVTEEPSIVAAASNAARLVRSAGGFSTEADPSLMVGQIQMIEVPDPETAVATIRAEAPRIVEMARRLQPRMVARGGGARSVEAMTLGKAGVAVHVVLDVGDAMGANMINTLMEALAPEIAMLTGGTVNLRILSNLSDGRLARARAAIPFDLLGQTDMPGDVVAQRIAAASDFAVASPHRATTHNKGVMNGIDSVAIATGNDWRAIEAGAHAYAARSGHYGPIAVWSVEDGKLHGSLEMPLAVGTVGARVRANPRARLALRILGVGSAPELARVMAAVGLAQNFAAIRALATEGIVRGHMALHDRCMADRDEAAERLRLAKG